MTRNIEVGTTTVVTTSYATIRKESSWLPPGGHSISKRWYLLTPATMGGRFCGTPVFSQGEDEEEAVAEAVRRTAFGEHYAFENGIPVKVYAVAVSGGMPAHAGRYVAVTLR